MSKTVLMILTLRLYYGRAYLIMNNIKSLKLYEKETCFNMVTIKLVITGDVKLVE